MGIYYCIKKYPVFIIRFILTTFKNEQHPCKCVRVDEDGALENSTYITNLLVDELIISVEAIVDNTSWLN